MRDLGTKGVGSAPGWGAGGEEEVLVGMKVVGVDCAWACVGVGSVEVGVGCTGM